MDIVLKMIINNSKKRYHIYQYKNNYAIAHTMLEALEEFRKMKIKVSKCVLENFFLR